MDTFLKAGDRAPEFRSTAVGGRYGLGSPVDFSHFQGETIVLYFYPKDDTPGCTTQACALRDSWDQVSERACVYGISPDSAESHRLFINKHGLPFPLITDEEKEIARAYGVWVEKSMYGKKYMGVQRATFVINPKGKIVAVFPKVKPSEHVAELLKHLE